MTVRSTDEERGSAAVEFLLTAGLIGVLVLAIVQFALVLHVRNTSIDAAAAGARFAGLAGNSLSDGAERTRSILDASFGSSFTADVVAEQGITADGPTVGVTVSVVLPLVGMLGVPEGLEVTGHAASEILR